MIYVWVLPGQLLAPPSYRRSHFDPKASANRITCLVGDEPDALPIGQTFKVSRLLSDGGKAHTYRPSKRTASMPSCSKARPISPRRP